MNFDQIQEIKTLDVMDPIELAQYYATKGDALSYQIQEMEYLLRTISIDTYTLQLQIETPKVLQSPIKTPIVRRLEAIRGLVRRYFEKY